MLTEKEFENAESIIFKQFFLFREYLLLNSKKNQTFFFIKYFCFFYDKNEILSVINNDDFDDLHFDIEDAMKANVD